MTKPIKNFKLHTRFLFPVCSNPLHWRLDSRDYGTLSAKKLYQDWYSLRRDSYGAWWGIEKDQKPFGSQKRGHPHSIFPYRKALSIPSGTNSVIFTWVADLEQPICPLHFFGPIKNLPFSVNNSKCFSNWSS